MSLLRIRAIFRKDMRDAVRDTRVLTALLMPLLLGLLYSFMVGDTTSIEKVKVGVYSPGTTQLTRLIAADTPSSVQLTVVTLPSAAAVRDRVKREKVDVGLVLSPGFDAAVRAGHSPGLAVLLPSSSTSAGGDFVASVAEQAVQEMAGRQPPARIVKQTVATGGSSVALNTLGARKVFVLVSLILLLAMVAVYAVPTVLVEETEKKTMDALTLIASTADVIAAKAWFGVVLSVAATPVLLAVTRTHAVNDVALLVDVVLTAVVLVGIGLLFGGLVKTQQQLNTWSGALLLPLLAPAFTVGLPTPPIVNQVLAFLPTIYTFRLAADAFAGRALYAHEWLSYAVLAAWGVAAYGLLWWRLARQEA